MATHRGNAGRNERARTGEQLDMTEQLSPRSHEAHTHETFDMPEVASAAEIQQVKDEAVRGDVAREQAKRPSIDEARAAVDAAFNEMSDQPQLGRTQKLRQLAGFNAYSKKQRRQIEDGIQEKSARLAQAQEELYQAQTEENERQYQERLKRLPDMRQTVDFEEGISGATPDDAVSAAEAAIAYHEGAKNTDNSPDDYPKHAASLVRAMEHEGIKSKYETIPAGSELSEAYDGVFVLDHGEKQPTERTVRIYRGVREVNGSVLNQVPPVMKGLDELYRKVGMPWEQDGILRRKEEVKIKIEKFMSKPTLDNLKSYVKDLAYQAQFESPLKRELLIDQMKRLETAVTEQGKTVEEALQEEHVRGFSGGANMRIDISPYIAASPDADAAGFYADGALLAIDVPESQIAGYGEPGEVLIKGSLTAENIAGVAIRKNKYTGVKGAPSKRSNEAVASLIR